MTRRPLPREDETPRPTAALRHPLFWGALATLLLNDHVLKSAGLPPGWLTGKLSDFSGLIVAPLVLAALLGGRRALAFGAVGAWFAGVNLVPELARASEQAMGLFGVEWRLWADPTDLIALAVMPLAWHMSARDVAKVSRGRGLGGRRALELSALLAGGFACIATSRNPDPVAPGPPVPPDDVLNIQNASAEPLEVRVRWIDGTMDCDAVEERLAETLPRDAFGAGVTYQMDPGSYATLDQTGNEGPECQAALVQSSAFDERIVFWRPSRIDRGTTSLVFRGADLEVPFEVATATPLETVPSGFCLARESSEVYGWSAIGDDHLLVGVVERVEETIDGCVELGLVDEIEARTLFLCVPPESFRFEVDEVVRLEEYQSPDGGRRLVIERPTMLADGSTQAYGRLDVFSDAADTSLGEEARLRILAASSAETCEGDRLECGAYRVAGALDVFTDVGAVPLAPGESLALDLDETLRAELYLGRAERILFTRPDCGAGRHRLGTRVDAVVTYWEEIE